MKLRITPLLEDDQSSFEADHDSMSPRSFVDLMDQRKALLFQSLGSGDEPFSVQDFGHFVVNRQLESYPNIGGEGTLQTNVPVEAGERIIFTASER